MIGKQDQDLPNVAVDVGDYYCEGEDRETGYESVLFLVLLETGVNRESLTTLITHTQKLLQPQRC